MRRILTYITLLVVAMAMALTSCHSNEQNYKQAYDKAVAKVKEGVGEEAYSKIEAERVRYTHVINGDSVRMVRMSVNVALDTTRTARHRYNVVVGEFKQQFNAITYRDRLRQEEGYPSYLLYGGIDKKYYVVIKGFDQDDVAAAFIKDLDKKVKMPLLTPIPWIIEKY